jgi:hypothetical protein
LVFLIRHAESFPGSNGKKVNYSVSVKMVIDRRAPSSPVCQDLESLPLILVYQGKEGNFQDIWLDDFDPETEEAYFSTSLTGWTNNQIGFEKGKRKRQGPLRNYLLNPEDAE